MLGLGWTEMLVIGIVALIVIGPKDLPDLMHKIGKFAGQVRRMGQDFQRELNKTTGLNEITSLRNSITSPLKATTDAIRKEFNTTTASGAVQPSGAIKPADPKAESIVNELHAAAGMTPPEPVKVPTLAEAMKEAIAKSVANAPTVAAAPAAAATVAPAAPNKRTTKPKAESAPTDAPAKPKATPRRAAAKPVESPAPIEAIAPAPAKPTRKRTPKPAADAAPQPEAAEPAVARPRRAKKPAATGEA